VRNNRSNWRVSRHAALLTADIRREALVSYRVLTAIWTQAERDRKALRPLSERGQETTIDQLQDALRDAREAPATVVERIRAFVRRDTDDLKSELEHRAEVRLTNVTRDLAARGADEADSLAKLLIAQRERITKAVKGFDPRQLALPGIAEDERQQRERERRRWDQRLHEIERELAEEPDRVRASYAPIARRLEPVGLVYLWPASN
jgi:hypothetical protein